MASVKITIVSKSDATEKAKISTVIGNEIAVTKACMKVSNQAKALAPVDEGLLRTSIGYVSKDGSKGELNLKPGGPGIGYVGTPVKYGVWVEFGTRFMRAQPYLRPAAEILKGGGVQAIKDILNNAMAQHLKRYTKGR